MPHHKTGSEYKVYPTYDFACPFVDSIEGITHALRSSEYHDRNAQYYRIQEDMELREKCICMSSKVNGWDDPRFPNVQGIVRRSLKVEALIQFILEQYKGAGEKVTRFTRSIWIDRADAESISVDEEVTLMDWGNAIVKIDKDLDGNLVLTRVLHLEGSVKTTELKLTWLPQIDEMLEEDKNFLDVLNPCTEKETAALGDPKMRNLKRGDVLQLERKGYHSLNVPYLRLSKPIVLFLINPRWQAAGWVKVRTSSRIFGFRM
ncbi:putative glutamate--tRNA ligase [Rosa chinensis]|uniref:Putative glutamate--tRNA ligase n=1 Tax=Rosa chinensis TaxID=74649 RepID=A0A2P6S9L4_ROSCH|nr:putative glutamate--tRNA ligase [Rosa chinensis]